MFKSLALVITVFAVGLSCHVQAQQQASPQAQALAASLDKNKYKKKEKHNIKIEIYIDIKNEAVVKANVAEYSGFYEADENVLQLKVAADGSAEGKGINFNHPGTHKMSFTLQDARVHDAVLTATKVYENGTTEKLEAVFVNRTVVTGTNADNIKSRDTDFGIGYVVTNKDWTSRVFLMKRD